MPWNWQLPDWPDFTFDAPSMAPMESSFLSAAGEVAGAFAHLADTDREELRIDVLSDEALETSRIEGEILDRESVRSSLRKNFGLAVARPRTAGVKERGIADLLADAWQTHRSRSRETSGGVDAA